jgi:integrase
MCPLGCGTVFSANLILTVRQDLSPQLQAAPRHFRLINCHSFLPERPLSSCGGTGIWQQIDPPHFIHIKNGGEVLSSKSEIIRARTNAGAVVIYERTNVKTSNLFYRIKIPGTKNKYERRTTGTSKLTAAKKTASNRYREILHATARGQPIDEVTFADIAEVYLKYWKRRYEVDGDIVKHTYTNKMAQIENYLIPFFGTTIADALTQDLVDQYPVWRETRRLELIELAKKKTNYKRMGYKAFNKELGDYEIRYKLMPCNVWTHRKPTKGSMRRDIEILLEIYSHAIFVKAIHPEARAPIKLGRKPRVRRGFFNEATDHGSNTNFLSRLKEALTENADQSTASDGRELSFMHRFRTEQLNLWANLMLHTGLRTNEMVELQFKHVEIDGDGDLIIKIVPELGSRGSKRRLRLVVADGEALEVWHRLIEFRSRTLVGRVEGLAPKPDPDEFVWTTWLGGRETSQLRLRFGDLLRKYDIAKDGDGNQLSAYSLRHTYCVRKLRQGVPVYSVALNMGTSIEMIEKHYGMIINTDVMKSINRKLELAGKAFNGNDRVLVAEAASEIKRQAKNYQSQNRVRNGRV